MAYADSNLGKARDRQRYHRRAAQRLAAGLCPKYRRRSPAPGSTNACAPAGRPKRVAKLANASGAGLLLRRTATRPASLALRRGVRPTGRDTARAGRPAPCTAEPASK